MTSAAEPLLRQEEADTALQDLLGRHRRTMRQSRPRKECRPLAAGRTVRSAFYR